MNKTIEIEEPKKIYKLAPQPALMVIGIILTAAGLLIATTALSMGILLIVLSLLNNRLEVVRIYEKYSEIKLAPAAPRRLIKNSSIKEAIVEKNRFILTYDENGKEKKIKIALKLLPINDRDELPTYYKSLI